MNDWPKIDRIPPNHLIFFWAFDLEALEENYGPAYGDPVNTLVIQSFDEVLQLGLGDIEQTDIMVFAGDVKSYYVLGISGIANTIVFSFINKNFKDVPGYQLLDFGSIPGFPLVPIFRFYGGNVIIYSDDSMSGKIIQDDEENYGTNLQLIYMEPDLIDFP
jgi:hypothetical protein